MDTANQMRPTLFPIPLLLLLAASPAPAAETPLLPPAAPGARVIPSASGEELPLQMGEATRCNRIERQVALLTPRVVVGEPVIFRLLLHCETPGQQTEFLANLSFGNDIRIRVEPPAHTRIRPYEYLGIPRGTAGPTATLDMEGIPFYRFDFRMAFDGETVTGAAFDIPGTYRIDFVHNCVTHDEPPRQMMMGTFELEVLPAEGEDARALELLDDLDSFRALHLHNSRGIDRSPLLDAHRASRFERLFRELPGARIRPHAGFVLADHYLREERVDEAMEVYSALLEDYPDTPFAETAMFLMAQTAGTYRSREEARALYHRAWSHPSATQLIHPRSSSYTLYVEPFFEALEPAQTQWVLFERPAPDPESESEVEPEEPRIYLADEVQEMLGLPGEVTADMIMERLGQSPR